MIVLLALLLAACETTKDANDISEECKLLCDQLVSECAYGAYPSYDSCAQGCAWDTEQGADVKAHSHCVEEAACDTFAIVECEHTYGVEAEG